MNGGTASPLNENSNENEEDEEEGEITPSGIDVAVERGESKVFAKRTDTEHNLPSKKKTGRRDVCPDVTTGKGNKSSESKTAEQTVPKTAARNNKNSNPSTVRNKTFVKKDKTRPQFKTAAFPFSEKEEESDKISVTTFVVDPKEDEIPKPSKTCSLM